MPNYDIIKVKKFAQFAKFCILMSGIERKYRLVSTSYLAGLFDIFILLHMGQNCVCFGDFLQMRTLCGAYHEAFESH